MGFFSRIKKLWGAEAEPHISTRTEQAADATPITPPPTETPSQDAQPGADAAPAPEQAPHDKPEARQPDLAESQRAETAQASKESGWRKLLGFGAKAEEKEALVQAAEEPAIAAPAVRH